MRRKVTSKNYHTEFICILELQHNNKNTNDICGAIWVEEEEEEEEET